LGQRFPLIVTAALTLRKKHFVLDGEAVVLDPDGVSDFDALRSRKHDKRAQFYKGIFIAEYEQGDIGDVLFRVACNMGSKALNFVPDT
jgi:bifunctional non-homologous end joining protein LigD